MEFIDLLEMEQKEKEDQQMTFYAVYQDTHLDGSYDTFVDTFDKVSDAIRCANELENSQVFLIED